MITLQMLKNLNACEEQIELFQATFGESVEITRANFDKAIKAGLDIKWFIYKFSKPFHKQYKTLRESAWESYKEIEYNAFLIYKESMQKIESESAISNYITEEMFNLQMLAILDQYNAIESNAYKNYKIAQNNLQFSVLEQIFGKD